MKNLSLLALAALAGTSMAQNFKGYQMDFVPANKTQFKEVKGVMEFTGRMHARPNQVVTWQRMGLTEFGAQMKREAAVAKIQDIEAGYIEPIDVYIINVPKGMNENQLAKQLMKTGLYEYVEPDYMVYPQFTPNDPSLGSQWSHTNNNSTNAWDICRGNSAVKIGITDTGVHCGTTGANGHEDLKTRRVLGGNSATATTLANVKTEAALGSSIVKDLNGHGTHCTGIAAATGNNGLGIAGVSLEGISHMMCRVSDSSGGGSSFTALTLGALYCASQGARVVSTSYSGFSQSVIGTTGTTMKNTYNAVWCYAAGNDGGTYGAAFDWPDVTIVAAIDSGSNLAGFSARGVAIDLSAPGVTIFSTWWSSDTVVNTYANLDGTSMATPYAAGVASMILAVNPGYTAQRVQDILYKSCNLQAAGSASTGWGRVNLWNAMGRKANTVTLDTGQVVSGVVADLWRIEGNELVVKPFIVANSSIPPVQVVTEHDATVYSANNYSEIAIMTKCRLIGASGAMTQNLQIWNFTSGAWENVGSGSVSNTFFEAVKTVNSGNVTNYISAGKIRSRVQFVPGPLSNANWSIGIDQINQRALRATE